MEVTLHSISEDHSWGIEFYPIRSKWYIAFWWTLWSTTYRRSYGKFICDNDNICPTHVKRFRRLAIAFHFSAWTLPSLMKTGPFKIGPQVAVPAHILCVSHMSIDGGSLKSMFLSMFLRSCVASWWWVVTEWWEYPPADVPFTENGSRWCVSYTSIVELALKIVKRMFYGLTA